jgi:hypothetical protein
MRSLNLSAPIKTKIVSLRVSDHDYERIIKEYNSTLFTSLGSYILFLIDENTFEKNREKKSIWRIY